jgi:transcriptional regulator with XRE-family HTH domain
MNPTPTPDGLGQMVAKRLNEAGITLREAEQQTGIALATLHRRLRNGSFTLSELNAVADLLNTTSSALLADYEAAA